MNNWELARYFIDAKKCIDSLLYIDSNIKKLCNLSINEIIEEKLRHFYINLCIIFDKSFSKTKLKQLQKQNSIVEGIYYERDKNYAHKDIDYKKNSNKELHNKISRIKNELKECKKLCKDYLPDEMTIEYVSYDRNLFRFVNQISPELEKKFNKCIYNSNFTMKNPMGYEVFDDTEDIRNLDKNKRYFINLENGITLKEGLQNRQDACIKTNVLLNTNMWSTFKKNNNTIFEEDEKTIALIIKEIRNID